MFDAFLVEGSTPEEVELRKRQRQQRSERTSELLHSMRLKQRSTEGLSPRNPRLKQAIGAALVVGTGWLIYKYIFANK
ncbi:hypothetical protein MRX96_021268 [Rhipicephalus microplus]